MSKYQSDEKIAQSLNTCLPKVVKEREQCISNNLLVESEDGSFIIYVTRNKSQQLMLVIINLSVVDEKNGVLLVPIVAKNDYLLEGMWFQIAQSPYMMTCFSFLAYDPKQKREGHKDKLVYFSPINFESIKSIKQIQLHSLSTRQHGNVKDIKWYPFASLTLIVLTQTKILTFKLDIDHANPISEIYIKDLRVSSISKQTVKNGFFQKIAFAEILNLKEEYPSLGRKLTLYLIGKNCQIYLIFPFICPHLILNQSEQKSFKELKSNLSSQKRSDFRGKIISQWIKKGRISPIKDDEDKNKQIDNTGFVLEVANVQSFEVQLYKLNLITFSRQSDNLRNTFNSFSVFKVLTLNRHTIFMNSERLMSNQQQLKVQIFSQQPYEKLLNLSTAIKSDNLILQTVGEFKFDGQQQDSNSRQRGSIKLFTQKSMTNDIFVLHNNLNCYRFSFDGLQMMLANGNESISQKLIDCDVLFKSNSEVFGITNSLSSIFFIRYQNNTYIFQSIPLQSLQLRQIIRTTVEQTQKLFQKLANQPQPNPQTNKQKSPALNFEKLNQASLIEITQKLNSFNKDSKKYIQTKLEKIQKLSNYITLKQSILEQQQRQKQQLVKLITKAQQNDKRIKQITSNNSQNLNKTQREMERRIRAMHKTLNDLKQTFTKENQNLQEDEDKREIMIQCNLQADSVIEKLENTKQKLLQKRDQLKKVSRSA